MSDRDAKPIEKRTGWEHIKLPPGTRVLSVREWNGRVIAATSDGVYDVSVSPPQRLDWMGRPK